MAYDRVAAIEHHLHHYGRAVDAWQQAVATSEQLLAAGQHTFAAREYLVRQYAGLAASLEKLGRVDEADKVYQEGIEHVQAMADELANQPKYRLEVGRYQLRRAGLLSQLDRPDEAEEVAVAARETLTKLLPKKIPGADPHLLSLEAGHVLSRVCWQQDRFAEARTFLDQTLSLCQKLRLEEFSDLRPLVLLEVDLRVLEGDPAVAAGEPEQAIQTYREALDLKRQTFRAKLDPALFEQKTFMNKELEWDGQWEPGAFTEYNEVAQRLVVALSQAGRPYEAETLLGECVTSAGIIDDTEQGVLQYGVAQANAVALAAQLLADGRPEDADKLRAQAADEWCRILGEFPHAAEYHSGVHGLEKDLAWFQQTFPGERLIPRPPNNNEEHDYGRNAGEGTIFIEHSAGRLGFRSGAYDWCLKRFQKSAAMRASGQEYDWLYLTMAHAKLGQHDEAQEWTPQSKRIH